MLELIFFTSNPTKLAHAKHLCREYDIKIHSFHNKTYFANYKEPRLDNREEILRQSYNSALEQAEKAGIENKIFIIEDTSVIIDALSQEHEVPGVDIKYWMANKNFNDLDRELKELGNNRKVTIRSDLILHLPQSKFNKITSKTSEIYTSSISGTIVNSELNFNTNPLYPWLDNKSFNKWFVPNNHDKPISCLPIDEADKYDFRKPAFQEMLNYLFNYGYIKKKFHFSKAYQKTFDIEEKPPLFIICGPTCAGKTTIAQHLVNAGYHHIEASDYMYNAFYNTHGTNSNIGILEFALSILQDKPQTVPEQIANDIKKINHNKLIITGFRSPKEVEWFLKNSPIGEPHNIFIEANQDIRFQRFIARKRDSNPTIQDLKSRDEKEIEMGINFIHDNFSEITIVNEGTIEEFYNKFDELFNLKNDSVVAILNFTNLKPVESLEALILIALLSKWENIENRPYFTTTEISKLINETFALEKIKEKDNISRYFNQAIRPYYEVKTNDKGFKTYRLSNTGCSLARLLYSNISSDA